MGVTVEHEAGSVSVSAKIFEDEPLILLNPFKLGVTQGADLVKTIAGRTKHSSGDLLTLLIVAVELLKAGSKTHWGRSSVVVDDVVEGAVNTVINI